MKSTFVSLYFKFNFRDTTNYFIFQCIINFFDTQVRDQDTYISSKVVTWYVSILITYLILTYQVSLLEWPPGHNSFGKSSCDKSFKNFEVAGLTPYCCSFWWNIHRWCGWFRYRPISPMKVHQTQQVGTLDSRCWGEL